ncbi:MAG: HEAT repeat domain-containing protein [Cyanobacteria bacterium J06597_1]
MDNRFLRLFDMSEEQAIALLDKPADELEEDDVRYVAAAHLINFPTERSIAALIRAVENTHPSLNNRITRRKAVETLGKLKVERAMPSIKQCLQDSDRFTVENAVNAIADIGTSDTQLMEDIADLLVVEDKVSRTIIRVLSKLDYKPAIDRIRPYADSLEEPLYSAALSALYKLNGETERVDRWLSLFQSPSVNSRRCSIQDAIDSNYVAAIPAIARCPVSVVFRMRALRLLGAHGLESEQLTVNELLTHLDLVVRDHPRNLELVHTYDRPPALDFLMRELFNTDFGRSYLAIQTVVEHHVEDAPTALLETYQGEASSDYGANYHVLKTLGWLQHEPAYDKFLEALHQTLPQYQKSRTAAAIALGELGDSRAIPDLKSVLDSNIWGLQYGALLALETLGDTEGARTLFDADDVLLRSRAQQIVN